MKNNRLEITNRLELWYQIAKIVAETDSVGEGYSYCLDYTRDKFEKDKEREFGYAEVAAKILDLIDPPESSIEGMDPTSQGETITQCSACGKPFMDFDKHFMEEHEEKDA